MYDVPGVKFHVYGDGLKSIEPVTLELKSSLGGVTQLAWSKICLISLLHRKNNSATPGLNHRLQTSFEYGYLKYKLSQIICQISSLVTNWWSRLNVS